MCGQKPDFGTLQQQTGRSQLGVSQFGIVAEHDGLAPLIRREFNVRQALLQIRLKARIADRIDTLDRLFDKVIGQWQQRRENPFDADIDTEAGKLLRVIAQILGRVVRQKKNLTLPDMAANEVDRPLDRLVSQVDGPIQVEDKTLLAFDIHLGQPLERN